MAVSYEDVLAAAKRIEPYVHRTPVMTCSYIDDLVGRRVFFKCENFQKTGSFKIRGALNAAFKHKEANPHSAGVATHSSGNHGQALSHAATTAGIPVSVIVPNNTPVVKCDAIRGYGGKLVFCQPTAVDRIKTCQEVCDQLEQTYISSHDHPDGIAGQGTIAKEFLEEVPELDAIFACASGGGMVAGMAVATKAIKPSVKVFVVEPKGKDLGPCMTEGKRLWTDPPQYIDTIADGIRVQQVGKNCFQLFMQHVEKDVFTVDNEQIAAATHLVWSRMKLVVETSAGATVAAILSDKFKQLDPTIKNIGVILCGGNIDLDKLPW